MSRQVARRGDWLVVLCYLLAAVVLTWRLWAHPTSSAPTNGYGISPDVYLSGWFMRYAATAVVHGKLPALVTTAVNFPHGISVMWNTSFLLPSILLTPVTLLAGPFASLTVALTVGFAGSAASLFYVLRRWGASVVAAGIGGALYGFSPALLVAAEDHYHLQFAVLPPLIIDATLRLVTGRGRPVRTGAWLGALVTAQMFIAEELLVDTAIAALLLVLILAISRPSLVRARIRDSVQGLGTAVGLALLAAGYALVVQFLGPLNEFGSPWHLSKYGNIPADFVTAPQAVLVHGQFSQFTEFMTESGQRMVEYFAYIGWPLLGLLALIGLVLWRDLKVRLAVFCFASLALLSVGGHTITFGGWHLPVALLPWRWLWHAPVLGQALPNRFSILADAAAGAAVAFAIDRARTTWPALRRRWREPVIALAVAAALVPVIPRPLSAAAVRTPPPGWQAVMNGLHLHPGAPVLVLPPGGVMAMEWQAITGEQISIIGGYCITRAADGHAAACNTASTQSSVQRTVLLRMNWLKSGMPLADGPSRRQMATALSKWRPAAVIAVTGTHSMLARYLVGYFGQATMSQGDVLGWRIGSAHAGTSRAN